MKKKNSLKINIIILVLAVIIVQFFLLRNNLSETIKCLLSANIWWILGAVALMMFYIFCQSISQYLFLKETKSNYKLSSCFKLMLIGQLLNAITPFSSGGQPFQIYMLKKEGIKVSDSANALLQNFITFQVSLVFMGTVSIICNYYFNIIPKELLLKDVVLLGFIVNISVIVLIIFLSRAKRLNTAVFTKIFDFIFSFKFIKNKDDKMKRVNEFLDNFYNSTAIMKNNKKNTIISILFNIMGLTAFYLIPLFVFYSLNKFNINGYQSIISSAYTYLIGSFVPIPGGTGGLEYSFKDFFRIYSGGAILRAAILLWRLITYYLMILVGLITLIIYRRKE